MPAYNAGKFIAQSIESVLNQSYTNWELIIVDDGSTDNTRNIVEGESAKDSRVRYCWQPNGRQGKARNNGMRQALGDYIAFLDADDLWQREKLETQLMQIKQSNADLVFANCTLFDNDKTLGQTNVLEQQFEGDEGVKAFIENNQIAILTVLCKKETIDQVGGFSEKKEIQNAEDYHLWLKLLFNGCRFQSYNQVVAHYRIHEQASTSEDKTASLQVGAALLNLAQDHSEWKEVIETRVGRLLKKYLFHHRIKDSDQAYLIGSLLHSINHKSLPPGIISKGYKLTGDKLLRRMLLTKLKNFG